MIILLKNICSLTSKKLGALDGLSQVSKFRSEVEARNLKREFEIMEAITNTEVHHKRKNAEPTVGHLNRYTDMVPCNIWFFCYDLQNR